MVPNSARERDTTLLDARDPRGTGSSVPHHSVEGRKRQKVVRFRAYICGARARERDPRSGLTGGRRRGRRNGGGRGRVFLSGRSPTPARDVRRSRRRPHPGDRARGRRIHGSRPRRRASAAGDCRVGCPEGRVRETLALTDTPATVAGGAAPAPGKLLGESARGSAKAVAAERNTGEKKKKTTGRPCPCVRRRLPQTSSSSPPGAEAGEERCARTATASAKVK